MFKKKKSKLVFHSAWFLSLESQENFCWNSCPGCQGKPQPSRRPLARNLAMSNKWSAFILTLLEEFDWNYICPDNTQQSALLTFVSRYIWKQERWPWAQLLFQFWTLLRVYWTILPNTANSPNGKTFSLRRAISPGMEDISPQQYVLPLKEGYI